MTFLVYKKVVVNNFTQFKEVLEKYNTYNHIYLMNDITITEDIFIEDFKKKLQFKEHMKQH